MKRNVTNILISSMSVSDLLSTLICVPLQVSVSPVVLRSSVLRDVLYFVKQNFFIITDILLTIWWMVIERDNRSSNLLCHPIPLFPFHGLFCIYNDCNEYGKVNYKSILLYLF